LCNILYDRKSPPLQIDCPAKKHNANVREKHNDDNVTIEDNRNVISRTTDDIPPKYEPLVAIQRQIDVKIVFASDLKMIAIYVYFQVTHYQRVVLQIN
jgi:hypothetical protein